MVCNICYIRSYRNAVVLPSKRSTMREMWEQRYGAEEYAYGREPNEFFKSEIGKIKPGRLLVAGAGEGRDAVYAATQGWQVDAFDLSEKGREKALRLAADHGVQINFSVTDAARYVAVPGSYDAVALIYFHLPPVVRTHLYTEVIRGLKPGGVLVVEAFTPSQLSNNSGGPKDISMLVTAEVLRGLCADMRIVLCEETQTTLNEGPYHQGHADIVRLIAVK
ncbi:MAG: methyltransferase domain-containing protein [Bacteroidetes bacterium]|nr:methyltransferase domain-containing protein [Bacteroidota bacterium]